MVLDGTITRKGVLPPELLADHPIVERMLAEHARRLALPGLSMGMSSDYETAALLGSTVVRVGSALFGTRD